MTKTDDLEISTELPDSFVGDRSAEGATAFMSEGKLIGSVELPDLNSLKVAQPCLKKGKYPFILAPYSDWQQNEGEGKKDPTKKWYSIKPRFILDDMAALQTLITAGRTFSSDENPTYTVGWHQAIFLDVIQGEGFKLDFGPGRNGNLLQFMHLCGANKRSHLGYPECFHGCKVMGTVIEAVLESDKTIPDARLRRTYNVITAITTRT